MAYRVCLRRWGWSEIQATSYREDPESKRIRFFLDDKEVAFFAIDDVCGFQLPDHEIDTIAALEVAKRQLKEFLETPGTGANSAQT